MSAELGWGKVLVAKERALLIALETGDEPWIPRSVIEDDSEIEEDAEEGAEGELVVKSWFAEKEGLI